MNGNIRRYHMSQRSCVPVKCQAHSRTAHMTHKPDQGVQAQPKHTVTAFCSACCTTYSDTSTT
jgi:hypothetical protein